MGVKNRRHRMILKMEEHVDGESYVVVDVPYYAGYMKADWVRDLTNRILWGRIPIPASLMYMFDPASGRIRLEFRGNLPPEWRAYIRWLVAATQEHQLGHTHGIRARALVVRILAHVENILSIRRG